MMPLQLCVAHARDPIQACIVAHQKRVQLSLYTLVIRNCQIAIHRSNTM